MTLALDTSASVPFLMTAHPSHRLVRRTLRNEELVLTQQSLAETYSVLTRLPCDARVDPLDACRLLEANFGDPMVLPAEVVGSMAATFAAARITGGSVYDGLVGLAAKTHGVRLATRDVRAAPTYAALDVDVVELFDEVG